MKLITGSNAFLLSSDLATLFTGRTFPIEVYPFSFKEFIRYYALTDQYAAFRRYMNEGGMSGSYVYKDLDKKYRYIAEIFDTLILRDIRKKNRIKLPVRVALESYPLIIHAKLFAFGLDKGTII